MRHFLILSSMILANTLFAATANEEAIILNQELQFLEDSISTAAAAPSINAPANTEAPEAVEGSLERTYFSDSEQDAIKKKQSAPKRRSF